METRVLDQAVIQRFRKVIESIPKESRNVAIVGREADYWPEAVVAAEQCAASVILMEERMLLHGYKRALNAYDCRCLIYGEEYEEMAYRVENDGTTLVEVFLAL